MAGRLYEVWHLKADAAVDTGLPDGAVEFPTHYELVARVRAQSPEEVLEKTTHRADVWWDRQGVECLKSSRSTAVDDVVVGSVGDMHVLAPKGWVQALEPNPFLESLEAEPTMKPSIG